MSRLSTKHVFLPLTNRTGRTIRVGEILLPHPLIVDPTEHVIERDIQPGHHVYVAITEGLEGSQLDIVEEDCCLVMRTISNGKDAP